MRSKDVLIPHVALPFQFLGGGAGGIDVNEQDTIDDVYDCVQAIVRCPRGFRPELREFGTDDQTFSERDEIDLDLLYAEVAVWEPRASMAISQEPAIGDWLTDIVKLRVSTIRGPQSA